MIKVALIDYKLGNIRSIINAFKHFDIELILTNDSDEILSSDAIVLPGVGAFGTAMKNLKELNLIETIKLFHSKDKPILGICLGMQILFEKSQESPNVEGLSLIQGDIKKLDVSAKLPHIGWNSLLKDDIKWQNTIFENIEEKQKCYFVHSFVAVVKNQSDILATTTYENKKFCCAVKKGNLYGCQFHPEKSAETGLKIIKSFINIVEESKNVRS
jgi:glutamine amidotransferase